MKFNEPIIKNFSNTFSILDKPFLITAKPGGQISLALILSLRLASFMQLGFSLSNRQKVQFNTDLFSDSHEYLYKKTYMV